ncbi:Lipocalin domain containing protein [Pandoravirus macleodensis]|uniref:Lipocalin domain containing protein n=1 Tax=Pandoravirus macleodensis TaxID=2107707 RepID=A0A2U7UG60_9VIRU|nr:Lipocalin domain containing protein [Pandoravirus macleodensis]AVK77493.1 Lipocalin domain containing protein [Pandoravirus macleodensis]UMO80291.1 Lipocalin domain containing protein [Pandoravirus aubagnensis]
MFSYGAKNNAMPRPNLGWQFLCNGLTDALGLPSPTEAIDARDNGMLWPETVDVNWREWVGTWYEVARLPVPYETDCAGRPRATYTARAGSSVIGVVNDCVDAQGRSGRIQVQGTAVPIGPGRLWVDFGRAAPESTAAERALGNYWILYVDPTYNEAIVATPDLQSAWALSRYPCPEPQAVASLLERMHGLGIDIRRLVIH